MLFISKNYGLFGFVVVETMHLTFLRLYRIYGILRILSSYFFCYKLSVGLVFVPSTYLAFLNLFFFLCEIKSKTIFSMASFLNYHFFHRLKEFTVFFRFKFFPKCSLFVVRHCYSQLLITNMGIISN